MLENPFFSSKDFEDFFCGESSPRYDIYEEDNKLVLDVALAGYSKEDLNVSLTDQVLTISANKSDNKERKFVTRGISRKNITLRFNVRPSVEVEDISFVDGLLKFVFVEKEKDIKKLEIK